MRHAEELVDGVAEAPPLGGEVGERLVAVVGQMVVAAWRALCGLDPGGLYKPLAAEPSQ